jgi:hypothetical protein
MDKHGDFPYSYVNVYQRVEIMKHLGIYQFYRWSPFFQGRATGKRQSRGTSCERGSHLKPWCRFAGFPRNKTGHKSWLPSGIRLHNYGKIHLFIAGKIHVNPLFPWVIFNFTMEYLGLESQPSMLMTLADTFGMTLLGWSTHPVIIPQIQTWEMGLQNGSDQNRSKTSHLKILSLENSCAGLVYWCILSIVSYVHRKRMLWTRGDLYKSTN